MARYIEDLDRNRDDDDGTEHEFHCPWCQEVLCINEAVVLEQHPEMLQVCLNCVCG